MSAQFAGETSVYWKWCHAWQLPFNGFHIVFLPFFFGGSSEYALEMASRLAVAMCWCPLLERAISLALSLTQTLSLTHSPAPGVCTYSSGERVLLLQQIYTRVGTMWKSAGVFEANYCVCVFARQENVFSYYVYVRVGAMSGSVNEVISCICVYTNTHEHMCVRG